MRSKGALSAFGFLAGSVIGKLSTEGRGEVVTLCQAASDRNPRSPVLPPSPAGLRLPYSFPRSPVLPPAPVQAPTGAAGSGVPDATGAACEVQGEGSEVSEDRAKILALIHRPEASAEQKVG
uniref:Uncharacterized protein n=1 Tax=uncultured bacterium contig00154 TaxID=1181592 RepID=A0A806K1R6_9BACT|nr:hypothetical protein [uncultured bacterium contig00154]